MNRPGQSDYPPRFVLSSPGERYCRTDDSVMRRRYEAIAVGIIVYDPHGRILYANHRAEKILNIPRREMCGSLVQSPLWKVVDEEGNFLSPESFPHNVSVQTGRPVHNKVLGLQRADTDSVQWLWVHSEPVLDPATQTVAEVIVTFSDITIIRDGAEALRESERRLMFALQSIQAGEWEMNLTDLGVRYSSRCAEIFLGNSLASSRYSYYSRILDYVVTEDRDRFRRVIQAAIRERRPFEAEGRICRADGEKRWVQVTGRPYEMDGTVAALSGIVIDTTEKKRVEGLRRQALIHSHEAVMSELVRSFDLIHFVLDRQLRYTSFNQAQAELMRRLYGVEIAAGESYLGYVNESTKRNLLERNLYRALQGEVFTFEHYTALAGDERQCLEAVYCPIRDENRRIVGVAVFGYDSSEKKFAQESLLASERRYRKLVEDSNLVLLQLDEQGKILFLNKFGCDFFGYTLEELVGQHFDAALMPDLATSGRNLKSLFSQFLQQKSPATRRVTGEVLIRSKCRVWVEWSYRWVKELDSPGLTLVAAGVDMTQTVRARQEEKYGYQRRRRQELMNEAIGSRISPAEFFRRTRSLNLVLDGSLLCLLLRGETTGDSDGEEKQQQIDLLIDWLHESGVGVVWQAPDGICILQALPGEQSKEREGAVCKKAKETLRQVLLYTPGLSWRCGVAQTTSGVLPLAELYFQARSALLFGPALLDSRELYHWRDLGSYQLLVRELHSENTARFIEEQLGPLLRMESGDTKNELLDTLHELVTFAPVGEIAERLHVHRGTVRYRRAVLSKVFERDLSSVRTVIDLAIALKLWEVRQCSE